MMRLTGRVADPDPYPDSMGSLDSDPDPFQEGKNGQKNIKQLINFIF